MSEDNSIDFKIIIIILEESNDLKIFFFSVFLMISCEGIFRGYFSFFYFHGYFSL